MNKATPVLTATILALLHPLASGEVVSDGSLFSDDFGSGDLSKWKTVGGVAAYDGAAGNPAGSLHVDSNDGEAEGFARPNAFWANSGQTNWVVAFDVKVNDDTGGGFYIVNNFSPDFALETDIAIRVAQFDWIVDFYGPGQHAWDYRVEDATGSTGQVARLRAGQWHHFTIYRKASGDVDLIVNGQFVATYQARNPAEIWGELQVGDTSVGPGVQWGDVNWDNVYVGEPVPVPTPSTVNVPDVPMLVFDASDGTRYELEYVDMPADTNWMSAGYVIIGDGGTVTAFDPAGTTTSRTYRLNVPGR